MSVPGPPRRRRTTARTSSFQKAGRADQARQLAAEGTRQLVRLLLKDPLSMLLLAGSVALTILFFSLLHSTQPESPGKGVPLSSIVKGADGRLGRFATMHEQDSRVIVTTRFGGLYWAAYPSSDAQTNSLLKTFAKGGASVT